MPPSRDRLSPLRRLRRFFQDCAASPLLNADLKPGGEQTLAIAAQLIGEPRRGGRVQEHGATVVSADLDTPDAIDLATHRRNEQALPTQLRKDLCSDHDRIVSVMGEGCDAIGAKYDRAPSMRRPQV